MTDNTEEEQGTTSEERGVTVTRVIKVLPERVYNAFLDPDELSQWLPQDGFSVEVHEFKPVVGGTFRMTFTSDIDELESSSHTYYGQYEELVPDRWIVYTERLETDDPGMAGETTTTIIFEELSEGTEVTVRQGGIPEDIPIEDAKEEWINSLDHLIALIVKE